MEIEPSVLGHPFWFFRAKCIPLSVLILLLLLWNIQLPISSFHWEIWAVSCSAIGPALKGHGPGTEMRYFLCLVSESHCSWTLSHILHSGAMQMPLAKGTFCDVSVLIWKSKWLEFRKPTLSKAVLVFSGHKQRTWVCASLLETSAYLVVYLLATSSSMIPGVSANLTSFILHPRTFTCSLHLQTFVL